MGLYVVHVITHQSRRPNDFLTSMRLTKIPNFQIHKFEKRKILSLFQHRVFSVIFHEHKELEVIRPKKFVDTFLAKKLTNFDPLLMKIHDGATELLYNKKY